MARTKSSATKHAGASRTEIAQAAAAVAKPAKKAPAAATAAANDDGAVGGGTVSTRIVGSKTAAASGGGGGEAQKVPKKRRALPGTRALQEIEVLQKSTDLLVPKAVVLRNVREVLQNMTTDVERITPGAAAAIHEAAEMFMVNFLGQANDLAVHAKRVTVMPADVKLAKNIISTYTPIDLGIDHTGMTTMAQYRAERHVSNEKLRGERAARREAKEAAARDTVGEPAAVAAINDEGEKPKRANKKKKRDDAEAEDDAPVEVAAAAAAATEDEPKPAAKRAKKPKVAKEEKPAAVPVAVVAAADDVTLAADDAPIL